MVEATHSGVQSIAGPGQFEPRTLRKPTLWRRVFRRHSRIVLGTTAVVVLLGAWQVFAVNHIVDPLFTSYPSQIARTMVTYFTQGTGWIDLKATGEEFALGFALSLLIGIPMGILVGWYKSLEALLDPIINFLYNAPRIALAPLLVIWFGLGAESKIGIVVLTAVFPIMISTRAGVVDVDPVLIDMARSYGASDVTILRSIIVPGSVAPISSGVRIGIGQGLAGVVLAEFIASTVGLGYTVNQASTTLNTALMFDGVFVIAIIGVVLTAIFRRVENHFQRWRI